jgi:bifunctional DNase/RNase
LGIESNSSEPVLILKELRGERVLPIWIGAAEAHSIALVLNDVKAERPLTHDLLKTTIDGLGARVLRVVINDLRNNTYFAQIHLDRDGSLVSIDARPSDSIALALRTRSPIFVAEDIMSPASGGTGDDRTSKDGLKKYLRAIDPEDFGKFHPRQE